MEVHAEADGLVINLSFWEKVWSLHGSFRMPLSHIKEVTQGPPQTSWKDLRVPGTFLPGVIKAGSYYTPRGWEFWYVLRSRKKIVTIELRDEKYRRIVLSLDEGQALPALPQHHA